MNPALAVLFGVLLAGGPVLALAAWNDALPRPQATRGPSTGLWTRGVDKIRSIRRRTWITALAGCVLGLLFAMVLHWPVLLIVVPLGAVILPRLLSDPPQDDIRLLEALDRWVRGMLAELSTGKSIQDCLRSSGRQAPQLLSPSIALMIKRLDDRWPVSQALHAMADDLASPDSDAVLASLILSTQRGGTGASVTLFALADSIQDRLRALRDVETERSKPRMVVRQVTIITLLSLTGFMLFSPAYFTPYGTPTGQLILFVLLAVYVLSVWAMRRLTMPRSRERILRAAP